MDDQECQPQDNAPVESLPSTRTESPISISAHDQSHVQDNKVNTSHQNKCDPTGVHISHLDGKPIGESVNTNIFTSNSPDNNELGSEIARCGSIVTQHTDKSVLLVENDTTETELLEQPATSDSSFQSYKNKTLKKVFEEMSVIGEEQPIQGSNDCKLSNMEVAQEACLKGGMPELLEIQQPICTDTVHTDKMEHNEGTIVQKGNYSCDILTVGSFALVSFTNPPIIGTIRWIGTITGINGLMAGLELVSGYK